MELKIEKHGSAESFDDLCYEYYTPDCEGDWHGFELVVYGHKGKIKLDVYKLGGYYTDKSFLEFMKLRFLSSKQLDKLLEVFEAQLKNYTNYLSTTVGKEYVGGEIRLCKELYDAYYELKSHFIPMTKSEKNFLQYFSFFDKEEGGVL